MRVDLLGVTATDEKGIRTGLVPVELLDTFWPNIEAMIDRLPQTLHGTTKALLYASIERHETQVWVCADGEKIRFCVFSRIAFLPLFPVLEIYWAAGEGMLDKAGPTLEAVLEEFAFNHGCREMHVVGRDGWTKILEKAGFRKVATTFAKPISDRRNKQ